MNKKTPIFSMVDACVGCVKCGAKYGKCECWTKCECGWLFEKGGKCRNPKHNNQNAPTQ